MANELKLSISLRATKGYFDLARAIGPVSVTLSGTVLLHQVLSIGTSKAAVDLTGLTTPGWALLRNLDAANYVGFGIDADTPSGELKAGEFALYRVARAQTALSLKANTAACNVEVCVLGD